MKDRHRVLCELSRAATLVTFSPGEVVYTANDDPTGWYVVVQGSVSVSLPATSDTVTIAKDNSAATNEKEFVVFLLGA